jgi:hypothetical protein
MSPEEKEAEAFVVNVRALFGQDATGVKVYENLKQTYQDRSSFSTEPLQMAYREGQRSVFLMIQSIVEGA